MNEPKQITCPYCQNIAADFDGEIICGTPNCEAYPRIISANSATPKEKISALLASGAKTLDELSTQLQIERDIISGVIHEMKRNGEVSNEWSDEDDVFVWCLNNSNSVQTLTNEQKKKLILEAIKAGHHLPRKISQIAKLSETETIISLTQMEENGELSRRNELNFSAWFLNGKIPKGRMILDGNGGVAVVGIDPAQGVSTTVRQLAEREVTQRNQQILEEQKQMEQIQATKKVKSNPATFKSIIATESKAVTFEPKLTTTNSEPKTIQTFVPMEFMIEPISNKSTSKKHIPYSIAMFENYGKQGFAVPNIAKDLGLDPSAIYYQLRKSEYSTAYQNGLKLAEKPLIANPNKRQKPKVGWTDEILEDLATRHFEVNLAAREMEVHHTSLNRQLATHQHSLAAWYRGQQKYLENNPEYKPSHKSWYFKAKKIFDTEKFEPQKIETVENEQSFESKFDHIKIESKIDSGFTTIKCLNCYLNRSFLPFDSSDLIAELTMFEDGHGTCQPIELQTELETIQGVVVSDARLAHTLDHLKNKEFEVQPFQPIYEQELVAIEKSNTKSIRLGNGVLNVSLENVDFFDLDYETRMFVNHLINLTQDFEKRALALNK